MWEEWYILVILESATLVVGLRLAGLLLLVAATSRRLAVEHLHFADDDLGRVAVLALLVLPFASLQLPFDVNLRSLVQVLADHLGKAAPGNALDPLCPLLLLT